MSASKVEICNLAISWLGGQLITALTDNTTEAILCNANYEMSRRAVLEEREWTFAIKRVTLTPLVATPLFGYSYSFTSPPDSLRLINVYDPRHDGRNTPPTLPHVLEDKIIYADINEIDVKYIWDQQTSTRFSSLFDQVLAAHIASRIAIPLTENKSMMEDMYKLYDDTLDRAAASDGLQGSREMLETSIMEKSRRINLNLEGIN